MTKPFGYSSDFERALDFGRPPNIKKLFPNPGPKAKQIQSENQFQQRSGRKFWRLKKNLSF